MPIWCCWNCADPVSSTPGKQFESELPVCSCGVDGNNPRHKGLIVECCTMHFDPPDPIIEGRGKNIFACTGEPFRVNRFEAFTSLAVGVNCKECKKTPDYLAALKSGRHYVPPDGDFVYCKSC